LKARVKIISYSEEKTSIGPIELTSLKVIEEKVFDEPTELGDDPEEGLEKLARDVGNGDYVEAIAEIKGSVIRIGISKKENGSTKGSSVLFYRPSKLLKIGIVVPKDSKKAVFQNDMEHVVVNEDSTISSRNIDEESNRKIGDTNIGGKDGEDVLSEDNIVWYTPNDTIYVFEGEMKVKNPCEAVILLTEDGEKIYVGSGEAPREKSIVAKKPRKIRKKRRRRRKKRG
jgi:hypothetical protein